MRDVAARKPRGATRVAGAVAHFDAMREAAEQAKPFGDDEVASVVNSLTNLGLHDARARGLREVLARAAHLDYKNWHMTEATGESLSAELPALGEPEFAKVFARPLEGGGWPAAAIAAAARQSGVDKPWAVLVTGVNGIRKTTALYEPWFETALAEAIVAPDGSRGGPRRVALPTGSNSFFRQLDFNVATVANEQFAKLYAIEDVAAYARAKEAIFARYRTISEMLGAALVAAAKRTSANVLLETSGRDVGMYAYVDHFFPDADYHKLVLNFEIDDLAFAETSVDARMVGEMAAGRAAVAAGDAAGIVAANAGGPYGSAVLAGVQAASRAVWEKVAAGDAGGVGDTWYKASLRIAPRAEGAWTLAADVDGATVFEFSPRA